ncbi:LysR family transcriptional regulator [Labrenzia sp. OB1]|uniref:LysR family transcriptional regulator n=1 Tax=Labrenzia sp. OB1 TaxID=1561204 RepID=UPI0007B2BFC3|nr:LysR family transcriptional regulator [Labrenzia sp. OB1]KZM48217.1 LysR family transcriptional regulator [Labrenzia sp. OB1]
MDLFKAMATFVRVAEAGSLSAAGRDLGISQPAVSQQVSALERHLNLRLLNRTTRQLTLTEAGLDYYQKAQSIIDAVHEAAESAAGLTTTLTGHLRVHAPVGFGQSYIADIAIAFQQRHPDVVIELILDDTFVDLTAQSVDVAIRFGNLSSLSLIARRLGTLRRILVAAPDYITANGSPETPEVLSLHRQVQFSGAADGSLMPLIGPSGPVLVPVKPVFLANNAFALTRALKAGVGLGGAQLPQIRAELREGTLVRVMKDFEYASLDVHAVYPSRRFIPAKVRAFVDFLEQSLKDIW